MSGVVQPDYAKANNWPTFNFAKNWKGYLCFWMLDVCLESPGCRAKKKLEGLVFNFEMPRLANEEITIKLEFEGNSDWNSSYDLLYIN
jgi:hypothetical protein